MSFSSLNIIPDILKSLEEQKYNTPTPIQSQSIPIILQGKDLLGCAQTGTGKTAAFAIPLIQLLYTNKSLDKKRKIRSLIITPTRELAIQIADNIKIYGKYTNLKSAVIFGGVGQSGQVSMINSGIDILVATPGRLLDLLNQKCLSLSDIEIFVLDEADTMLDMGFINDIKKLLSLLPQKKQSLFFSATMPQEIVKLMNEILNNPVKVTVAPISSTTERVKQHVYFVDKGNKSSLLQEILKDDNIKNVLVFTRTKHGANKVVKTLIDNKISAEAIHGNKSQTARQKALANFKSKTTRVLVATDIAARGIDVDELEYVINYELPNIPETYVHRIGRTGRAGANGIALSFCDIEEKFYLKDIERLIGKSVPIIDNHNYPAQNTYNPIKNNRATNYKSFKPKSGVNKSIVSNKYKNNTKSKNR